MEGKLKQKYIDKFGRNIIYKSIAGVYHFLLLRCSIWKYKWYSNSLRNQKKGTEKISIVFLASMPEFWNSLKTVYQAAMDHSNIEAHLLLLPLKTEYGLWKYKEDNIYNIEVKHPDGKKETIAVPLTTEKDNIYNYSIEYDNKTEILNIAPISDDNDGKNYIFTYQDGKRETVSITSIYNDVGPKEVTITYSDNITKNIIVTTTEKDQYKVTATKDGKTEDYKVTREIETGKIGINIEQKPVTGFLESIKYAFGKFTSLISTMWITVVNLFTGKIGLNSLSGPVGIYHVVGESMEVGISQLIYLTAFLSINVGLINILPIPAFDGGRILFLIIEKIKGSPINAKFENMCHTIFFILIILLMIYITVFDIIRFA